MHYTTPNARKGTVMRYRKKPVVVEVEGPISEPRDIVTFEGTMRADPGDYIVTGVKNETYPGEAGHFRDDVRA